MAQSGEIWHLSEKYGTMVRNMKERLSEKQNSKGICNSIGSTRNASTSKDVSNSKEASNSTFASRSRDACTAGTG